MGKTTLAQTLAGSLGGSFRRVQFTPDLLPSDILGYNLYRQNTGDFDFVEGPVFANLVLADEINRASPRTQSAMLEAMNDRQVTVDGETRELPCPFLVVATQNDTSSAGTFPLPEPQLDRFLVSISMKLPDEETQLEVLKYHLSGGQKGGEVLMSAEELEKWQGQVARTEVSENLQRYLLALCQSVRSQVGHDYAVSTRATLALQRAAQGAAVLDGQSHVLPDHVQAVFAPVLRHRLLSEEVPDPEGILRSALENTPVP